MTATYFRFWGGVWGKLLLVNVTGANRLFVAFRSSGIMSPRALQVPVPGDGLDDPGELEDDDVALEHTPVQASCSVLLLHDCFITFVP